MWDGTVAVYVFFVLSGYGPDHREPERLPRQQLVGAADNGQVGLPLAAVSIAVAALPAAARHQSLTYLPMFAAGVFLAAGAGTTRKAVASSPCAARLGSARLPSWLGAISFSLYLVHEPVVVTTATLLRTTDDVVKAALVVPMALLAAWVFHLAAERPSMRLAAAAGRLVAPRASHAKHAAPVEPPRELSRAAGPHSL